MPYTERTELRHDTMTTSQILLLGAIAGFTIYLGLPLARVPSAGPRMRTALCATATGILLFLLWDVLAHAVEPVEGALTNATEHGAGWGRFAWLAFLLAAGFTVGLMALVYYAGWMGGRRRTNLVGPGAAAVDEFDRRGYVEALSVGRRLALLVATGIGVHNFAEGLAIGQAAAADELSLALALIIGFGLHNATEGFGVTGPLAAEDHHPSWRFHAPATNAFITLGSTWPAEYTIAMP